MSNNERRKEVTEFAKRLQELAKVAPDGYAKKDLYRALHFIRQRYTVSPEQKKGEILKRILDGISTFTELLTDTGYTKNQIERGLRDLLTEERIREQKVRRTSGAGRPTRCFFPTLK